MASPFVMKKALVQAGQKLYARGLVAGTDGNLSVRLDDDRILITPSGAAKGCLEPEDLIIVDIKDGDTVVPDISIRDYPLILDIKQ